MYIVKGIIKDVTTGKPIDNVNITVTDSSGNYMPVNGNNIGRTSDKRGYFNIPVTPEEAFVTFSFVGYKPLTIPAETASKMTVFKLANDNNNLDEVVISQTRPTPRPRATAGTMTMAPMMVAKASNNTKWWIIGGITAVTVVGIALYFMLKKK